MPACSPGPLWEEHVLQKGCPSIIRMGTVLAIVFTLLLCDSDLGEGLTPQTLLPNQSLEHYREQCVEATGLPFGNQKSVWILPEPYCKHSFGQLNLSARQEKILTLWWKANGGHVCPVSGIVLRAQNAKLLYSVCYSEVSASPKWPDVHLKVRGLDFFFFSWHRLLLNHSQ